MPKSGSKSIAEQLVGHALAPKKLRPRTVQPPDWQPREVTERVTLWSGGAIAIKIPRDARIQKAEELGITYLRFARSIKGGGLVNFFVHGESLGKLPGTRITARPEIKRKTFSDGLSYLYIDLHLVTSTEVNCRLIITADDGVEDVKGIVAPSVFHTPPPLNGAIIIGYRE